MEKDAKTLSAKPTPQHLTLTPLAWVLLLTLSIIWGGSFLFARIAVLEVAPLDLVFLRVALAALTLNAILIFKANDFTHSWAVWRSFSVMGVLNNIIPFTCIFYGQTEIGAGLAAIINAMTPIWTVIFAHLATGDEKIDFKKSVGMIVSFVGVAVLIGTAALSGLSGSAFAQMSVLGATISYGVAGVYGRRFAQVPPLQTARGQLTMSALLMVPVLLIFADPLSMTMSMTLPSWAAIASIIALAVVCTAFAYLLFFKILSMAGAVNISLVTFLIPPSAILLGIVVLGESLKANQIFGTLLILIGLLVIDGRLFNKAQSIFNS